MGPDTIVAKIPTSSKTVGQLIEGGRIDTVYGDVYIRRAREFLSALLDESSYRAIGSRQKEIDELLRQTRFAVLERDWGKAAEISARADQMRKTMDELTDVAAIAKRVRRGCHRLRSVFAGQAPGAQCAGQAKRLSCPGSRHSRVAGKEDPTFAGFMTNGAAIFPVWNFEPARNNRKTRHDEAAPSSSSWRWKP
jgi:hypothetical protein